MVAHGNQGVFRIDTTTLADGLHFVLVATTNEVGYVATKSFQLLVLNTPPELTILNPANGTSVSGQVGVTFLAKSNYLSNVSATIDGSPISSAGGYYLWNSASAPDGTHVLKVTATDQAGNVKTALSQFTTNNQSQTNALRYYLVGAGAIGVAAGVIATLALARLRRPKISAPPA
jgi:hypothetical protein